MNTTVVFRYLKKITKFSFSVTALLLLMSCPGEDMDCNDFGSIAEVPELILLTPEQTTYNLGDEVILKLSIPATNDYYGTELNLYDLTGDESARLVLDFSELFVGNQLTFIKGSQSEYPNWFDMPYDHIEGSYDLEIKVKFEETGNYSFGSYGTVTIQGGDFCNRFRIDSNVPWTITNGRIQFTVNE